MSKFHLKWSFNNSKVSKLGGVAFGIPAYQSADGFKTCPGAGACASICFARQGFYVIPAVARAREVNLAIIRKSLSEFEKFATEDLQHIRKNIIRLHDSGDFFLQDYLDTWFRIAIKFPKKRFYAYTKSVRLSFVNKPKNFSIVFSEGGIYDSEINVSKTHARIFTNHAARKEAGYRDGSNTDYLAIYAKEGTKLGLIYHGNKLMTEAQKRHFGSASGASSGQLE
jgi:hypothetical protein